MQRRRHTIYHSIDGKQLHLSLFALYEFSEHFSFVCNTVSDGIQ